MLEFDDLEALDHAETVRFYGIDWFFSMLTKDPSSLTGYKLSYRNVGDYKAQACLEPVDGNVNVGCTLKIGHRGKCLCWHPDRGVLKVEPGRDPFYVE